MREKQTERERKKRHREQKRFSIPCIRYGCEIFHIVVNRIAIMTFMFAFKLENYIFIGFEIIHELILINSSFELINGATGIVNEVIYDDDK